MHVEYDVYTHTNTITKNTLLCVCAHLLQLTLKMKSSNVAMDIKHVQYIRYTERFVSGRNTRIIIYV